jgi:hypothetical protein
MRVCIARQQTGLEEQQASGPNRRAAAKPGQDITSHHGLHLKKKESAQENSEGKKNVIR